MMRPALIALVVAGCVDHQPGITGTQSIRVELVSPADPGDIDHRLLDSLRSVTVNLTAFDASGEVDTSFDRDVQIYAQFLGTVTPTPTLDSMTGKVATPLAQGHLTAGRLTNQQVTLPLVFGPTTLWVEDGPHAQPRTRDVDPSYQPTYATGTSPTLWFRDPFIADIQTPISETAIDALQVAPLDNKQVSVDASRYGAVGRLIVTSVFSQGYTVSDVKCTDAAGTPPCVAAAYDHVEVFSFSAPVDQRGKLLQQGQTIDGFSGGVSEFNGLTEIGFPATRASASAVHADQLPTPVKVDATTWFTALSNPQGQINFERNEAAPIEIDGARACPLDSDFDTFNQWKLDLSPPPQQGPRDPPCTTRTQVINVITSGVISDLDPATLAGKVVPRVVGVLRPVITSGGPIWIIFPRSHADLTLP